MSTALGIAIVMCVVIAVVAVAGFAVFELTPFARHRDRYRDPVTHRRRYDSPHLETRDEFERRERI